MSAGSMGRRAVVVVMARYPEAGAVKTRLAASVGAAVAADLHRAFVHDLAARLRQAGLPALWAYWPPGAPFAALLPDARLLVQRGRDLGERMAAAVADALERDAGGVVLLGADVPHVDLAVLRSAATALEAGAEVVVGPSDDGGYYLLGLGRPMPELFRAMPWGGEGVYGETLARCAGYGVRPLVLPGTFDVDERSDLERLAAMIGRGEVALPETEAALVRAGLSRPSTCRRG